MALEQSRAELLQLIVTPRSDSRRVALVERDLGHAAGRLRLLCATLLYRSSPRLTRPPLNLETDELLGGVVEWLITACARFAPIPCASSSRCSPNTGAGRRMTWPAA
jgi:RNA polymerase sigma-70 factor (ECF subfamily)